MVLIAASALAAVFTPASVQEAQPNKVVGSWGMVSAQIDPDGPNLAAYGPNPSGLLVFTKKLSLSKS
jgi:hypothetical protein